VRDVDLLQVRGADSAARSDWIAVEEPLEIRVEAPEQPAASIAVTMRTPGHDDELAVGFLFAEGLLDGPDHLATPATASAPSAVVVRLRRPFDVEPPARRFIVSSSCGLCGKAALEHVAQSARPLREGPVVPRSAIVGLPARLRRAQLGFERTGGLHAAGVFDVDGRLVVSREDVGRHNAVDKVVGRMLLDGRSSLEGHVLVVSGRVSFELVQKAAMAGATVLCAVSAPSSLAVQAADRLGMTLVGFLRGEAFNVYAHAERIDLAV
jgi:FdhD protein